MGEDAMKKAGWTNINDFKPEEGWIVAVVGGQMLSLQFFNGAWRLNGAGDEVKFNWWGPLKEPLIPLSDDSLLRRRAGSLV